MRAWPTEPHIALAQMKERLKRPLPKNRFARSVSVLAGGTAAGQVIVVAASPILTRLYSPEDFGLLAVFAALIGILSVIASLRYQLAIPLPEDDIDAHSLVLLSSLIVLAITVILTLVIVLFGSSLTKDLNVPLLADYLWLLPVGLFLTGIYQVFNYLAIRHSEFGVLAKTKVNQSITMTVVQLGGYALGPLALILGRILGQSAGIFTLIRATRSPNGQSDVGVKHVHRLRLVGARYRNFPLISTWTGLAGSGAGNLPPILIAALFGPMAAGLFALTHRVLSQPMTVLGKAVGDVFYREAAQAHRENKLPVLVDTVYENLVALSLPIATFIFLAAPPVFALIFGEQWEQAGALARWMTVWLFFQFIASPPTRVYPILDKHGAALRFQLGLLVSSGFAIIIGALVFDSFVYGVAIMSMANAAVYASRLMLTYSLLGMGLFHPFRAFGKAVPWSLLCNLPLIYLLVSSEDLDISETLDLIFLAVNVLLVGFLIVFNIHRTTTAALKT